ncbi:hypothetical protein KGQ20_36855 [Catenulispora sp. NF23]|uniref:Uncharacterized protein n=1 Tax=Catenulispora pinistramenti TaxID=2705254 RepID=A0ABS5L6B5_9ACTN|nr:hypothetical protein [Catenulispora pinistramenti]MBS2538335.1 hypothetical protein [Catenulispora pinistramenti]MBS2553787.1 hypothetical protein [Catenulispora pinistramenti]
MDLVLVRLTAPETVPPPAISPEVVVDILWSVSVPDDRLEHVRARHGPNTGAVDLAVFLRIGATPAAEAAESLCRQAVATAPALSDWSFEVLSVLRGSRL